MTCTKIIVLSNKSSQKQVICPYLALHPIPISIMNHSIGGNHRQLERLAARDAFAKASQLVTKIGIVILVYHKLILGEFHLADIDGVVGTLYQHVYLGTGAINPIILHLPRASVCHNSRDAKRLLDLRDMLEANSLKRQATPRIPKGRGIAVRPKRRVVGLVLLHKLQIEQREVVHQAIDGIILPDTVGIGTNDEATMLQIFQHARERFPLSVIPRAATISSLRIPPSFRPSTFTTSI